MAEKRVEGMTEAEAIAERDRIAAEVYKLNDLDRSDAANDLRAARNKAQRLVSWFDLQREFES